MKIFYPIITIAIFSLSCKKDNSDNPSPAISSGSCLITKIRDSSPFILETFEYNSERKLFRINKFREDSLDKSYTFQLSGNNIKTGVFNSSGVEIKKSLSGILNSSGFISELVRKDTIQGIIDSTSFVYNSNGQLSQKVAQQWLKGSNGTILLLEKKNTINEFSGPHISRSTYTEGGLATIDLKVVTDYFYNDNSQSVKYLPMILSAENGWFEFYNPWYGKPLASKVPFKIKSGLYDGNNILEDEYTFLITPQLNANGSVSKLQMTITSLSNDNYSEFWLFEYNCN
jgi:hypothetical protein